MNLQKYILELEKYFYDRLNKKTTAVLYGSAVSGDWTLSRSDLDVVIHLRLSSQIEEFEEILNEWQERFGKDLLDGFLIFEDQGEYRTKRFYNFSVDSKTLKENVLVPDIWQIKNMGKYIFGDLPVKNLFPDKEINDLKKWATDNRCSYWIPTIRDQIEILKAESSKIKLPLTPTIWMTSGAARIKTLEETGILSSKQNAMTWFNERNHDLSNLVQVLIDNYETTDTSSPKLNKEEVILLYERSLELLLPSEAHV
ncbi:MAG: nucleotidyltransferase domain-containing protein [Bacteriovoracaceae bacterium]|nr:nucleotidyltransferase domain-containing protein [Bacteriovoracaceae bacterium]